MDRRRFMSGETRVGSLCFEYPLRPDYLAQLVLPRDMTKSEADRLCALIRSLVQPESTEPEDS